MPTYQILSPIQRDGKLRKSGTLTLPESEAAPLIKLGALAGNPVGTDEQGDQDENPATDKANEEQRAGLGEREQALRAALAELKATDPEFKDESLWTSSKKPQLDVVRKHPELSDVTRKEVDAAWAEIKANSEG